MSETVHNVRTIMTMSGNMKEQLTYVDNRLTRIAKSQHHWENGIKTTSRNVQTFTNKTGGLGKSLNSAALRFIGISAAIGMAMMAFQKLNQWIDTSVESFRVFDNSMAEVSTILTGDSYTAIKVLTAGVTELSVKYGQSAVDMSRGLYQILSAAIDVEKSLNMLNIATKASIAGLTSVETSVDVLTSIINSYGKSVEQAAGVSDILFQTVVRGKLRFEDLASALGYITPIASAAGVAFEEIAAALATVTRMGLHVDMATRGLALTIQNVVSPTKQSREAANKFGVDMSAVGLRVFGLKGFIEGLSAAVKKFGLTVLPTMVRNMRSLRVVMALASDEGLKGFKEDLDLVYASTGRTNEAMAKMISTQQRQAEIVKQSQEVINREIGKTWSPIKRNIEATKLWFAAFLAGGFSIGAANKEIEKLSDTLSKNRAEMLATINTMGDMGQQPIFTQLFNMDDYDPNKIKDVINSVTDVIKVQDYLAAQSKASAEFKGKDNVFTWATDTLETYKNTFEKDKYLFVGSPVGAENVQNMFDEVTNALDMKDVKLNPTGNIFTQITDLTEDVDDVLAENITILTDDADAYNALFSSIDAAREQVFNFKTNILELENAIANLSVEVSDVFTDLSGQTHTGTLGMAIDVKSFDTAESRLSEFATMIKNYGSEWEDMFYDIFEGKTFTVGGEEISYIEEYDTNLKDAVNTVYDFKSAQEEVKKVMNEVNKAIQKNNIEIAELQLKGMLRRRGQTRAEEHTIKILQIENMKERLKGKKAEQEAMNDTDKQEYSDAMDTIKEYFDSQKFQLFLMKDAREDDLAHMVETFDRKEGLLTHYQEALVTQEGYLERSHQIEVGLLAYIDKELPDISTLYEDVYGISIPESIQKSMDKYNEWLVLQGKKPIEATYLPPKEEEETPQESYIPSRRNTESTANERSFLDIIGQGFFETLKPILHLFGFSRGIEYMPKTMPIMAHEGETILPAGSERGGSGTTIGNITIQVKEVAEIGSAEKIAAILSEATDRRIITSGKSRARNKKVGNTYRMI